MIKESNLREIISFALVGIANTAVGYGAILAFMSSGLGPVAANAGGYALGISLSYFLNSIFTFYKRNSRCSINEIMRFIIAALVSWGVNLIALKLMLGVLSEIMAQGIAMVTYTVSFFLLSRRFVFSNRKIAP